MHLLWFINLKASCRGLKLANFCCFHTTQLVNLILYFLLRISSIGPILVRNQTKIQSSPAPLLIASHFHGMELFCQYLSVFVHRYTCKCTKRQYIYFIHPIRPFDYTSQTFASKFPRLLHILLACITGSVIK